MADLRLTVDDSALDSAIAKAGKLDGKTIGVKVSSGGSTGIDKISNSAKKLNNILSETQKFDGNGKLIENVTKVQSGLGKTTSEIMKMNKAGDVNVTTVEKQTSALSKFEAQTTKQANALAKISKLSNQNYADIIDQTGLKQQKTAIESLTPGTLEFDAAYAKASRTITGYEVAASNASFAQKKMAAETKAAAKQVEDSYKAESLKNKAAATAEKDTIDNYSKIRNLKQTVSDLESKNLNKYVDKNLLSSAKADLETLDPKKLDYTKYKQLDNSLKDIKGSASQAKYAQDQLTQANKKNLLSVENIKESMGTAAIRTVEWAATMGVLYGAVNAVRSMVTTSTAINDQMNKIQMVTGASSGETQRLLVNYQNIATELSSTTSAVAASAEVWLRQGRSIADTNSLIETSTVLSKVGFMDSATSAQMLTSAINGYGIAAEDAMSVVDKMSAIDVAAATSTEDLAVAMAQTASGAKIAGVSMDELLSYIATISDVTQASGDTIGVSLKTMFARINSVKLGSLTDGEGQDISRVETALKQYGITLRDTNGTARDTGDILDDLSKKWGTLTGLQKSEIAMQMAGVHQKEKFLVLMENYNKALGYQEIAANSAGSAMQKMSIWEESTEAATQRMTNQWEILSTKMVDSNFTKAIINLGTLSLSALSSDLGQLVIKLTMVAAAVMAINMATNKFSSMWSGMDLVGNSGMLVGLKKLADAQKEYKAVQAGLEASEIAYTRGAITSTVATQGLGNALKGVAVSALPIAGALALVGGGLLAADLATVSFSEHVENIGSMKTTLSENTSEIDNLTTTLNQNKDRIKEIQSLGTLSITDQQDLTRLNLSNQQLQTKIEALEKINELTTKQMSQDAISAINSNSMSSIKDKSGLVSLGVISATKLTPIDALREQMTEVQNIENELNELQQNKNKYSSEDYIKQYDELTEKQEKYSQKANETALTLNDLAASIDGTTEEGKKQLKVIDELNKQLTDNNKLVNDSSGSPSKASNSEINSQFNGVVAEDFSNMGQYISTIEAGLSSGLTENEAYKLSLASLFDDTNPPTDIIASLESLKGLFSESEEYAGVFLETLSKYQTESGKYNLKGLQNDLHLSDTAIATVNSRLNDMGLLMTTSISDGIMSLGNGLGLATDDSTEFELQLGKMIASVKDGSMAFGEAESYIRNYLSSLGVTSGKIEQAVDNFSMLSEGASEFNLLAFTGLTGEGELAGVSQAAESLAQNYVTSFKDKFASELVSGKGVEEIDLSSGFGVSAEGLETQIADTLRQTGLFTEAQISQLSQTISSNTINANFNIVAEGIITQLGIQDAGVQEQLTTILQANFNTETQQFDIPTVIAQVNQLQVEGVDQGQLASQIQPMLEGVNAKMDVAVNTDAAATATSELAKPEDKTITAKADTAAAQAAFAALIKTETKTIIVNEQLGSTVDVSDTTKTVYVNEVTNANGTGAGIGVQSATGRINVDTSQIGTQSLIGEEGEETLIRNGNVSFIGTAGAEIIPIRDGDTILPADITKRIKSGQIPMYASGKYSVSTSNAPANTDWYTQQRLNSSIWAGLAGDAPEDDEAKKAYEAHIKSFQKEYDYYKHLLDMGEMDEKDYYAKVNSLNDQYFKGKNEYLDEYRDHEKEVHDFLKKQEEERLKTLEENYSSSSSYVLDMLDDQIDSLKEQEELAEKQEKIDKLKGNKNQRVYYEGRGWVWEEDKTAIAEAEKDMKDDSASAKLQEYRDKWAEIADNYENEQNKLEAIALLGDDFEKKVLDGDLAILRDFATKYSKVLGDVSNNEGDTSVPLLDYAKAWEEDEIKRLMGSESTGGILTAALNNNLSGLTTSAISSNQSSSSSSIVFSGDINLENVTDFDSFITEAKHYARVNSPKR